jgi:hypothetical protein
VPGLGNWSFWGYSRPVSVVEASGPGGWSEKEASIRDGTGCYALPEKSQAVVGGPCGRSSQC